MSEQIRCIVVSGVCQTKFAGNPKDYAGQTEKAHLNGKESF